MIFWIIPAAMATLTILFLARPFMRARTAADIQQSAPDIALHWAQLAELENDLSAGLISPEQAAAARVEIERRLLAAAPAEARKDGSSPGRQASLRGGLHDLGFIAIAASGTVAVGLYMTLGTPGLPSISIAEQRIAAGQGDDFPLLVERLAARMAGNPYDARGWLLLASSYARLERFSDSAEAYLRAMALGSREPETLAAYGEVLAADAQGVVSQRARTAFEAALAGEPGNPRARYYVGLAAAQGGDLRRAYDTWSALVADTPATAPWRPTLEAQLRRVAADLGIKGGDVPVAGNGEQGISPSDAALAAAAKMSEGERNGLVDSMVDRLAARLGSDPEDFDGWMRLGHAYRIRGDRNAALQAFEQAVQLANAPSFDPAKRKAALGALDELKSAGPGL